jgi:mannose-6-phosphate isomerase-like protein (cupin superfamily)
MIPVMTDSSSASRIPPKIEPCRISSEIADPYHNRSLTTVNDHEVRMSVMTGGFGWHHHPDSDETFIGVDGALVIEFEDGQVVVSAGQMVTMPRGVVHRTRPLGARSVNLTFERRDAKTIFLSER